MASGETSFNSYTFTYEWTVNNLEARLHNPSDVESPVFSSPKGAQPATKWKLAILSGDCSPRKSFFDKEVLPIDHQHLSIELGASVLLIVHQELLVILKSLVIVVRNKANSRMRIMYGLRQA